MSRYATLDEWVAHEAQPFTMDRDGSFEAAVDILVSSLSADVAVLALGEGMLGSMDLLRLRNRLFKRLVTAHGFSAIALASSYMHGQLVNDYAAGRGHRKFETVARRGFSHGFSKLESNRELVKWIRAYNAEPMHKTPLRFFGIDSPAGIEASESPRQLLAFVLDYLATLDAPGAEGYRQRIEPLLGIDRAWKDPTASMDPAQYTGGSAEAAALQVEVEAILAELHRHHSKSISPTGVGRLVEAEHYAKQTQQLLTYHAVLAKPSGNRTARLSDLEGQMMADNVEFVTNQEQARGAGKVLVVAQNSQVQRREAAWQLDTVRIYWRPAGAHLAERFGSRYAAIGTGVGAAATHGLGQPEVGTLEARLIATSGAGCFIPTQLAQGLPSDEAATLPSPTGNLKNTSYVPLAPHSLSDFDWLAVLRSTA